MYRTVMVPLDTSDFSRRAIPAAVAIAREADAELYLTHVHASFPPVEGEEPPEAFLQMEDELRERERAELEAAAEEVEAVGLSARHALLDGPVTETLAREAEAEADLVVMVTHGRGVFTRFWLGSVADGLVRSCSVPLYLLRPEEGEEQEAPGFDHVLVPLDGSSFAEQGLEQAVRLGRLVGARFTLLQVLPPVMMPGYSYPDIPEGVDPSALEELREEAETYLERKAGPLRDDGLEVGVRTSVHPQTAAAILETADEEGVDLVAMATHGRGGLRRMVLGSVADKVLRGTRVPVMVYRPREEAPGG